MKMDKIVIKKSANQEGIETLQPLDPKKLVIKSNGIAINPRFCIHNSNLQRTTSFSIDSNYRYSLDKSDIKIEKTNFKHFHHNLTPDVLYICLYEKGYKTNNISAGKFYIHLTCNCQSEGTIQVKQSSIYEQTDPTNGLGASGLSATLSNTETLNVGINKITLIAYQRPDFSNPYGMGGFGNILTLDSNVDVNVQQCWICIDDELDHFIEPKYQDIVLDYTFNRSTDEIKFDTNENKWIGNNGELSESDQEKLNSMEFYADGTYIVPCCIGPMDFDNSVNRPCCIFEYQEQNINSNHI